MSGFRFTLSRPATTINSIPSWQDLGNGAASWGISGISQVVTLGASQTSNWLADDILNPYLGTYNFLVTATGTVSGGAGNTAQITFHFLDADENIIQSGTAINIPNAGLSAYAVAFTATPITPAFVMIQVNNLTGSSNTVTVAVTHVAPTSSLVISEPDGWKGAKIKWERDPEFFSIIEYFDGAANGAFIFYGQNSDEGVDGGIEFIRDAEADFGFDVKLSILIEYTSDDVTYTTLFQGLLDVSMKNEMPDNKMQVPVIQDDLWVKFVNRYESQVNLSDNVDLDGNPVDPVTPITVRLTCQKIQKKYAGRYLYAYTVGQLESEGYEYYQPDFEQETFNEIEGKITLPRLPVNAVDPMFIMEEDGEYTFDIKLTLGHSRTIDANFSYSTLGKYIPYIQVNDGTPVAFTGADVTYGSDVVTEWTYNDVLTLSRLDQVRIYVEDQFDFSTDRLFIFGDEGFQFSGAFQYGESYMNVTGNTTYIDTEADAYLIHDAFHGVCARLGLGTDSFYSEFLGSTLTNSKQYASDGCGWMYAVLKGLHVRGYGLSDKPFFTSLKELWEGINPILNVYLGYETISLVDKIRIEQKGEVIGPTAPVNFSNVRDITSTYDKDFIFKTIKTGYKKWQAEEISGLNDPQTKHTYQTVISRSGREISLESGFIAASGAIETTRRTTIEKTADYKLDNDTFIISLNTNDFSPDVYVPELDENFSAITGLLNYETRYNLVLTPMRNLLRWANYLGGCLQTYLNSSYKFVSGEGNFAMASNADLGACERAVLTDNLAEDDDISLASYNSDFGFFFLPLLCDIKIPMEKEDFDLLDRKRPIGISQSDSGHTLFHIKEMEYELIKGEATIKAWPETFFNITVPEQEITPPTC